MMSWDDTDEAEGSRALQLLDRTMDNTWRYFSTVFSHRNKEISDFDKTRKKLTYSTIPQSCYPTRPRQTRDHGNHGICTSSSSTPRLPRREGRRRASREKEKTSHLDSARTTPHPTHTAEQKRSANLIGLLGQAFSLWAPGNPKATSAPSAQPPAMP